MTTDVTCLARFYEGPLGQTCSRLVGHVLAGMWPELRGRRVLGLGYATPYLPGPAAGCERVLAFMPAAQGVVAWPGPADPSASALVDALALPVVDEMFDRVLAVHALEASENPAELLHEIARVLVPGGRVVLVCPNRRGLWARMDTTPFGHGQPFSRSQLRALLRRTALAPERWAETLYVPPLSSSILLRSAGAWERLGAGLSLPFAGLHVVEAAKTTMQPVLVRGRGRAIRARPGLVPIPVRGAAAMMPADRKAP